MDHGPWTMDHEMLLSSWCCTQLYSIGLGVHWWWWLLPFLICISLAFDPVDLFPSYTIRVRTPKMLNAYILLTISPIQLVQTYIHTHTHTTIHLWVEVTIALFGIAVFSFGKFLPKVLICWEYQCVYMFRWILCICYGMVFTPFLKLWHYIEHCVC